MGDAPVYEQEYKGVGASEPDDCGEGDARTDEHDGGDNEHARDRIGGENQRALHDAGGDPVRLVDDVVEQRRTVHARVKQQVAVQILVEQGNVELCKLNFILPPYHLSFIIYFFLHNNLNRLNV